LEKSKLVSIIEGILFLQTEPVGVDTLSHVLGEERKLIAGILDDLVVEYKGRARGFELVKVAEGFQFRTLPEAAPWILELRKKKPAKLSRASLETLSIIAYNQPVTRNEIEQIRGVESAAVVRNLVDRDLVAVVGRKEIPGRPLLYATTRKFLEVFGLPDLASLPALPELSNELELWTQEDLVENE
jgi:segregation and condensation protein B